jgi:hypothetical protein
MFAFVKKKKKNAGPYVRVSPILFIAWLVGWIWGEGLVWGLGLVWGGWGLAFESCDT